MLRELRDFVAGKVRRVTSPRYPIARFEGTLLPNAWARFQNRNPAPQIASARERSCDDGSPESDATKVPMRGGRCWVLASAA
jgi:hypothetical protein